MKITDEAIAAAATAIRDARHENQSLWHIARLAIEAAVPKLASEVREDDQ